MQYSNRISTNILDILGWLLKSKGAQIFWVNNVKTLLISLMSTSGLYTLCLIRLIYSLSYCFLLHEYINTVHIEQEIKLRVHFYAKSRNI